MIQQSDSFLLQAKIPFRVEGESMIPLIKPGEQLYFRIKRFPAIRVNDLVLFKKASKYIVHRVIYRTSRYLVTKGDNNLISDGLVYKQAVLGVVIKIRKNRIYASPETFYLMQSGYYLSEINRLKRDFNRNGLNYLFLKGLPLHLYYERTPPRHFYADCDVLINPVDLAVAQDILYRHGYLQVKKPLTPSLIGERKYQPELIFYKKIHGYEVMFDLHQELVFSMTELGKLTSFYPRHLLEGFTEQALKTKRVVKFANESYPVLNPNFLVLYLALHLFHHNFRGALRYAFLRNVIEMDTIRRRLNWQEVLTLTKEYRLANYIYPVLQLYNQYFTPKVPSFFFESTVFHNLFFPRKWLKKFDIFSEQGRLTAGITRFYYLFLLSPCSIFIRLTIFFNPQILLAFFWVSKQYFFRLQLFKKSQ